ncbi:uncharacterized protein N7498_009457 [Penicillium cinerascens]|uniref:Uncharacterized protein n=1 Tax=Penicillium cinerascens TaxID=70096 RepID=A0A9W9J5Y1_9EURO|nr:uncharacterized protein N7498_009457 [Penicillium cinerascens]KAJ5190472.1 hypothetical protein N7498_009457 [Penicillium cinerascens]
MMQPYKGSDFLDTGAKSRSRTSSISSDSQHPRVNLMSPPAVRPPPGFVSSAAASEIITSDQEFNAADFVADDEEPGSGANALVTPAALSLLNNFLDNLLFNILAASKSTQLTSIRPCLADVLKPRLAGEVVATADEELSEYMGGAEDEQTEFRGGQQPGGEFDLVRSWKLTRLRCMVYTRLGDMEEEDEDEYIAQEGLGECDGAPRRFSSHVDNITPAAAIFLTSIIEHIGERALVIAGETARSRLSAKLNDSASVSTDMEEEHKTIDQLVVEDLDMEKLALNATLGRLWRTWRKRRRGTTVSRTLSRAESRESFRRRGYSLANSRKSSIGTIEEPVTPKEPLPEEEPTPVDPAAVPLPMGDHDVLEIEVPGYSHELEGEVQTMEAMVAHKVRPRSLMVFPSPSLTPRSPGSRNASPVSASAIENPKSLRHSRSRSLPNAAASTPCEVQEPVEDEQPSPTSSEKAKMLETMYEDDESAEFVDAAESATGLAISTPSEEPEVAESDDKARMPIVHEEEEPGPPVNETVASLRSASPEEEMIDQITNTRVPVSSLDDRSANGPEVIEGQGMCEKPRPPSTIQRPRRQSSRDSAQSNAKAIVAETSELDMQSVVVAPQTQGAEPTTPAATIEAIESPNDKDDAIDDDQNKSVMSSTPATQPAVEDVAPETTQGPSVYPETTRPSSTSGDSELSSRSRRHKPTPLIVAASNRSSAGAERAAVQRMPPRPSTSISSAQPKSRRSESFNSSRDKRPVTAGSTTSQVSTKIKGIMGRQPGDSPSLRLRSSSETSRESGSGDSVENDTSADLDKLINSDETIHFTLTPRSVREMSFPESGRPFPRSDTKDTHDLADFIKNTGPYGEEPHKARASISSKATGELTSLGRVRSTLDSPKSISVPPISPISPRVPPSPKPSASPQARDARPSANSTREFAEFIKSTGPVSPSGSTFTPSPPPSVMYQQGSFGGAKTSRPPSTLSSSTKSTSNSNQSRAKSRLVEPQRSATSELIDFIREGPSQPGTHRIPRTVAPFRNTADSDDLRLDSAQQDKGTSLASAQESSRTGVLDSSKRIPSQPKAKPSASDAVSDDPRPTRKQHRVLDPYAIPDDDDEEEDDMLEDLINAKPPQRQEESLIDFLRSEPPPDFQQSAPQPLNINIPQQSSSNGFVSSASDLKSRLRRGNADKGPSNKMSLSSLRSQNTLSNGQSPSNYAAKIGMERNPGTIPSASNKQTETGALADFLRNTGPPEPRVNMNPKMKEGSFSRFFSRRRKVEA